MFTLSVGKEQEMWALKPINCRGHALTLGHRNRSYQELPIRTATGHPGRLSASLAFVTLCKMTLISFVEKIRSSKRSELLDFSQTVYGNFGFTFYPPDRRDF
ncbi:threonyl-trna synthetase [Teratosphaeria destructans]|uniref:Threonyl-trna synthetase n=1 Tax=Teratosphaeria destructans TaxID=418781 RepID=A0A9W7T0K6_9PEZI|nr:threonyl-trna synthetase [Teratosphaeria destructans]